MNNEEKVLDVLKKADKPLKGAEIASMANMDKNDVDKSIKKLKAEEKIISPIRCFYQII